MVCRLRHRGPCLRCTHALLKAFLHSFLSWQLQGRSWPSAASAFAERFISPVAICGCGQACKGFLG